MATRPVTSIVDVAAGNSHSLALKGDGSLWAAGWNYRGEFGTGDTCRSDTFVKIGDDVSAIAARGYCTMIIRRDSTLWVTGMNNNYHLGLGGKQENTGNRFIKVLSGVHAVSIGTRHTLALKGDGTVWGAGDNSSGQLGTGEHKVRHEFEMVLSKVVAIAGGNRFTLALRTDGILWAAGGNGYGEFRKYGIYDNTKMTLFRRGLTDVASMATSWDGGTFEGSCLAIKTDGTVWRLGPGFDEWTHVFHQ